MYTVEFLIERLKEQIEMAPRLEQNDEPGGAVAEMVERLTLGIGLAVKTPVVCAAPGGPRKYTRALEGALAKIEPLGKLFAEIESAGSAKFADPAQMAKAKDRLKDKPAVIVKACEGAIKDLQAALAVIEEGEVRAR